jgi:hypothetical protein
MSSSSTERVLRADNSQRNEMAVALWHGNLRHNPANPMWAPTATPPTWRPWWRP